MNTWHDGSDEDAMGDILLCADERILYAAKQHPSDCEVPGDSCLSVRALGTHLNAILREYTGGQGGSARDIGLDPLQRRFEVIAQTNPGANAVRFNGRLLTYGELDTQADELALHLQQSGLLPGSFCILELEPSLAKVRASLAVLKSGSACLHCDPALSRQGVGAVLAVFRPSVLFTRASGCAEPDAGAMWTIYCDDEAAQFPYGWPFEFPVGAGTPAHAFATVSDSGGLCMSVRTHKALGAGLDTALPIGPFAPAATAPDPADFWQPLSKGALLTIAPRA
ncbi:MAG: hypothetical protein JWR56_2590 [Massilia sp.]|nr:hypothetical protein [Massilia sp.]